MSNNVFQLTLDDAHRLQRNLRTLKSELDAGPQSYRTHESMKLLVDVLLDVLPQDFIPAPAAAPQAARSPLELTAPSTAATAAPAPAIAPLEAGVVAVQGSPTAEEAIALLSKAMPNAGAEITPPTGLGGKPSVPPPPVVTP